MKCKIVQILICLDKLGHHHEGIRYVVYDSNTFYQNWLYRITKRSSTHFYHEKGEREHQLRFQNMRTIPDIYAQIKAFNDTSVCVQFELEASFPIYF